MLAMIGDVKHPFDSFRQTAAYADFLVTVAGFAKGLAQSLSGLNPSREFFTND